jgi:SNF2 family DNA or RNA helicase
MNIDIDLDFIKFFSDPINTSECTFTDPLLLMNDYRSLCIIDKNDIPVFGTRIDKEKIKFFYRTDVIDLYFYGPVLVYPYLEFDEITINEYPESLNHLCHIKSFKENKYKTSTMICKLNLIDSSIDYYINRKIINDALRNRRNYKINILSNMFEKISLRDIQQKCQMSIDNIMKNTNGSTEGTECNEEGTECNEEGPGNEGGIDTDALCDIQLYQYQKDDIKWLKMIQHKIDTDQNTIEYEYNPYVKLDLENHDALLFSNYNFARGNGSYFCKTSYKYYGANLISEMGLGKSIVMLCYLLEKENTSPFIDETENDRCNYFYKRGKKKGSNCSKKAIDLYCKEHLDTPFIDKMVISYKNLDEFKLADFIEGETRETRERRKKFKTNASLILCPSHLCDQWVREYYSKFKKKRRVLLIVTYDQYTNLTFGDILFADLIVMSYNFLTNTNYMGYIYGAEQQEEMFKLTSEELLNSKKFNVFHTFKFKSVVLDEFHEIITMPKYTYLEEEIMSFTCDYRWNISGTPFAHGLKGFLHGANYICGSTFDLRIDRYSNLTSYLEDGINSNLIDAFGELYRRNTKKSIVKEYKGSIINEQLKLLHFTDQERNIYDSYTIGNEDKNYQFLIKLCCDPEINAETYGIIKNCKTFDEIQEVLLSHNKNKLDTHCKTIADLEDTIEFLTNELKNELTEEVRQDYEASLTVSKRNLTNEKKASSEIRRIYDYLKDVINNLKNSETCPICLDDIENVAITKCGHKFCSSCIDEFVKVFKLSKCPKCNIPIDLNDIFLLKESNEQAGSGDETIEMLVNKVKSTKLGNVIYYLKNNMAPDDKCIIFSQWDPLLHKLGDYLEQSGCNIVYCDGTVYQRKKAISNFTSDKNKTNIIMLSSKNAASGINLTAANKIILLEPVYGTAEYRKAIENQAIGRADRIGQKKPIQVIRFIIKDTIEEKIVNEQSSEQSSEQNCERK